MSKKTFEAVKASGSSLLVQVKDNQPLLAAALARLPMQSAPVDVHKTKGRVAHGRQENRTVEVFTAGKALCLPEWECFAAMAIRVTRVTHHKITSTGLWKTSRETSWYVTDRAARSAEYYGDAIRGHWGIENPNHRVRDGAFQEDASRIRKNPGVMARFRSIGINIFRFNGVKNISKTAYENAFDLNAVLAYAGL